MQPYRLEMGTVYANPAGKDRTPFGKSTGRNDSKDLKQTKFKTIKSCVLEYSKAARLNKIDAEVISPVFKDEKMVILKSLVFMRKEPGLDG